jgi:formylglycine-generating enzyme required for sulfatase activity
MAEDTAYSDALPLLAFTLEKLYKKCKAQGQLTHEAYDDLGGVSTAIKHAADKILSDTGYAVLPADDLRMRDLRRAFYSLAQVGEESQFTRRTARWSQIPASCEDVLQRFVNDRLLVSSVDDQSQSTLSVAHEALFRVWDTLNGWLLKDRKALALRAQIEEAAAEWETENRAESRAWPEERILDAMREIEKSGVSLDDVENRATVDAFLGPTDPQEIARLAALGPTENATAGSSCYGDAWRLPLGHEARASTGVRLALLGDNRKGVGLRNGLPDIDWCRIESGEVTIEIRSNPDDLNSKVVKRLTRAVEPFWMARYPVTVLQFQAFLQDCYRDGRWRLPPGFAVNLPDDYPPPKHRVRYGNHPADSVNWWDALVFCHWLSVCLGFEVRLPTEYEWQLAATGGDSTRTYPWGPDWDPPQEPWRANTLESGLNRSTAVGMYPAGASPAGILDMAGTVWEWCLDPFEIPEATGRSWLRRLVSRQPVQDDRRVLRGGSWYANQVIARAANRSRDNPINRNVNVGFRVVCSSPSLDTDH